MRSHPVKGDPDSCGHPRVCAQWSVSSKRSPSCPMAECPARGAPYTCDHPRVYPACGCPRHEPPAQSHSMVRFRNRALTPPHEAVGPDGGFHDKIDGMSPPARVSSDSLGHQTNKLPCRRGGLLSQNRWPLSYQNTRCCKPRVQADL
jgi:hypothetical protein